MKLSQRPRIAAEVRESVSGSNVESLVREIRARVEGGVANELWNSYRNQIEHNPDIRNQIDSALREGKKGSDLNIEIYMYNLDKLTDEAISSLLSKTLGPLIVHYHPRVVGFSREPIEFKRINNTFSIQVEMPVVYSSDLKNARVA